MAKGTRNIIAAAGMTAFVVTGGTSRAAGREALTIVLHVANHAGTGSADLAKARAQTERVFDAIGVRTLWLDSLAAPEDRECPALHVSVALFSPDMVQARSRGGLRANVLGRAQKASGRAEIYPERIRALSGRTQMDDRVLLGRAIAHEIGHLVLPEYSHSEAGIMAGDIDTDPTRIRPMFTPGQARAIRALLESRASNPEDRRTCGN